MAMRNGFFVLLGTWLFMASTGATAEQKDQPGCKDHPLFPSRMPDYVIEKCTVEDYGVYQFQSVKGPKTPVEGRYTLLSYSYTVSRSTEPSGLAVVQNYVNAIQKVGGTVLQSDPQRWVNGKLVKNGQEAWFEVVKGNGKIWLRVVEKKAMTQTIVADAAAFSNDIRATGHAAVYGITFDTDSTGIKPESAQAIDEVGKLLKSDPGLKIVVVGHTDNVGAEIGRASCRERVS
jgi:hypothetical protein